MSNAQRIWFVPRNMFGLQEWKHDKWKFHGVMRPNGRQRGERSVRRVAWAVRSNDEILNIDPHLDGTIRGHGKRNVGNATHTDNTRAADMFNAVVLAVTISTTQTQSRLCVKCYLCHLNLSLAAFKDEEYWSYAPFSTHSSTSSRRWGSSELRPEHLPQSRDLTDPVHIGTGDLFPTSWWYLSPKRLLDTPLDCPLVFLGNPGTRMLATREWIRQDIYKLGGLARSLSLHPLSRRHWFRVALLRRLHYGVVPLAHTVYYLSNMRILRANHHSALAMDSSEGTQSRTQTLGGVRLVPLSFMSSIGVTI
ncbi:uncharacterized protein C8Q71DRAFT_727559 [Rhodofomes roseus]|uniref:Uncharacterized protein n=1 Tax=Rhodofomes roseus TaxID=34475 RepID=A0ABQ8K0X2_9APHY|nr:uncharacterized protein C8Q71DRAFT_727559 [Rhodofomes roseus]KAH9830322.1 hypothetical protein C8Q71DRAFT_727559 [Rhodofomes roseus]